MDSEACAMEDSLCHHPSHRHGGQPLPWKSHWQPRPAYAMEARLVPWTWRPMPGPWAMEACQCAMARDLCNMYGGLPQCAAAATGMEAPAYAMEACTCAMERPVWPLAWRHVPGPWAMEACAMEICAVEAS